MNRVVILGDELADCIMHVQITINPESANPINVFVKKGVLTVSSIYQGDILQRLRGNQRILGITFARFLTTYVHYDIIKCFA